MASADPTPFQSSAKVLLFDDLAAFRGVKGLAAPDRTVPTEVLLRQLDAGKVVAIDRGSPVVVLDRVEGEARVSVATGPHEGRVGRLLDGTFPDEAPRGRPYDGAN